MGSLAISAFQFISMNLLNWVKNRMVRALLPLNALGGFPLSLLCLTSFSLSSFRLARVKGSSLSPQGHLGPQPRKVSKDRIGMGSSFSGSEGVSFFGSRMSNALPARASLVILPWFSFIKARRLSFSTPCRAQRSIPGRGSWANAIPWHVTLVASKMLFLFLDLEPDSGKVLDWDYFAFVAKPVSC